MLVHVATSPLPHMHTPHSFQAVEFTRLPVARQAPPTPSLPELAAFFDFSNVKEHRSNIKKWQAQTWGGETDDSLYEG